MARPELERVSPKESIATRGATSLLMQMMGVPADARPRRAGTKPSAEPRVTGMLAGGRDDVRAGATISPCFEEGNWTLFPFERGSQIGRQ